MPRGHRSRRAQGGTKLWYPQMGVVMSGAEFGLNFPGTPGTDYGYSSTTAEHDYWKSNRLKVFRLLFRWERVQRTLGGTLDATELGSMDSFITTAWARGIQTWPSLCNFGGYRTGNYGSTYPGAGFMIGATSGPTQAQFVDLWTRLAAHYAGNPAIYGYGLMGEPRSMPTTTTWPNAAQAAINAIRAVDTKTTIIVCGDDNGAAAGWNTAPPNGNSTFILTDTLGNSNFLYEAHCYFDRFWSGDYSESYATQSASYGVTASTGANMLNTFTTWLQAHNGRGIIGEWGIPTNDSGWYPCARNFMAAAAAANIPTMVWGGGSWWGGWTGSSPPTSIYPNGTPGSFTDAPTLAVFESYAAIANEAPA
jgi:endoglucanase